MYLILVVALINLHDWTLLATIALLAVAVETSTAWRALNAILFFNLGVSLGMLLQGWWQGGIDWEFLGLFNLRVFAVTFLTLYTVSKLNMAWVLSFSPTLQFLYVASLSQIESYRISYRDFRQALKSRCVKALSERKRYDFLRSMLYHFVHKSVHNARERTAALKARGFFDHA
ncbi:hypothetical protein [Nitratifractor sp.]